MKKIKPNVPCPCGSKKKYKKCCAGKKNIPVSKAPGKPVDNTYLLKKLDEAILSGYLNQKENDNISACISWKKAWGLLKGVFPLEVQAIDQVEEKLNFRFTEFLVNWLQDFEMALDIAGKKEKEFYQFRIDFCHEFCMLFPQSDRLMVHNMKKAAAESFFALGKVEEGEKEFQFLIKVFPDSAWAYIGWGDMYYLCRMNDELPFNYEKAKSIYEKALTVEVDDRDAVQERLEMLEEGRNNQKTLDADDLYGLKYDERKQVLS